MSKNAVFTKNMTFAEAISKHKDTVKVLKKFGLQCTSCSGMVEESLEMGAVNHGIDPEEFLKALNALK